MLFIGCLLPIGRTEKENENKINMLEIQLSVAPMMDWVDRRYHSPTAR
jgi:hypothetical protein